MSVFTCTFVFLAEFHPRVCAGVSVPSRPARAWLECMCTHFCVFVCVSQRITVNVRLCARPVFSYSSLNQIYPYCTGLMSTNRRQRGDGGKRVCSCVCVCAHAELHCKQGGKGAKTKTEEMGQISRAEGERTDKAEWKMREWEGKRTTTWFHPLLSHSWQRLALVTDRQITLLWLIKPGYRWRETEDKERGRGNEDGREKEEGAHKNRQGKKSVKKRCRWRWGWVEGGQGGGVTVGVCKVVRTRGEWRPWRKIKNEGRRGSLKKRNVGSIQKHIIKASKK